MIVRRILVTGAIEFPLRTWRRGGVGRWISIARSADRTFVRLCRGFRLNRQQSIVAMGGRGAHLRVKLIASHYVTQRKKHAGEQQHQKKQTDDVPPFQNAFPRAGFPASHAYFFTPPKLSTQLLIISMGSGNTIVVFFSTPISVKVCR